MYTMMILKQMRNCLISLFLLGLLSISCHAELPLQTTLKTALTEDLNAFDGQSFRVLCYHDTRDHLHSSFKNWPERAALDTKTLIDQFEWLRENGYHVVSLDAILAARNGGAKLPPKAILLTFDDGYASTYTHVYPLLKLFQYPAVIGLVGEWLEQNNDGMVYYGDRWLPRSAFVTWPQVREMVASGLVEVGSHSYGLHKGVISNPQGSLPSAAITRIYNPKTHTYEDDPSYTARIRADLARNAQLIARETGKKPRVMIWPYGAYNMLGVKAAQDEGMPIIMTLEAGTNTPDQSLTRIRRSMMVYSDKISDLKRNLNQPATYDGSEQPLTRIVALDLDSIYDPNPIQQEKNVDALIERIHRLGVNTVYIRAVTDLDHDGYADAAYFPNRHLPVRADLFNRVAWQLETRSSVPAETFYAYAWLPIDQIKLPSGQVASQQELLDIYDDAGKNAPRIGGLLVGDLNQTLNTERIALSKNLITRFRIHQPYAFSAVLNPADALMTDALMTDVGLTRNTELTDLIPQFDFITISLSTQTLQSNTMKQGLIKLSQQVAQTPNALNSTAWILPASDDDVLFSSQQIAEHLQLLQQNGARNFGYYADQVKKAHPLISAMHPVLSLHTNPGK
jgi:peptidoglycan/xylan/chitin deacetylase (PgdA/CDA1 family)